MRNTTEDGEKVDQDPQNGRRQEHNIKKEVIDSNESQDSPPLERFTALLTQLDREKVAQGSADRHVVRLRYLKQDKTPFMPFVRR